MPVNEGLNFIFLLVLYKNMTFLPTCDWSKFLGLSTNCGFTHKKCLLSLIGPVSWPFHQLYYMIVHSLVM
jgi:hypothetical protein